ncbi:MAG: glycosyltransferase family 1 protein [Candidatus Lokiarchaeota archaeon]|nr:glycosyltransferase family 1 protein [Candidatus Lokiarchaeota archaeon]
MEANKIKIVIVSPDNPFKKIKVGGKHIHILNFYKALENKEFNVEVITFKKNISKTNPLAIFSYIKFKLFGNKLAFNLKQNSRFYFLINEIEEDLVKQIKNIINKSDSEEIFFIAEDIIAIHAINRAGVDQKHTFSVIHGYFTFEALDMGSLIDNEDDLKYFYDYEKKGYAFCSKIVTVDSAIKDYLIKDMSVFSEKINVIYNAIDINEFKVDLKEKSKYKQEFFKKRNIITIPNLILIARRLVNKNGVYYAVESMSHLRKIYSDTYKNTLMVICGDGPEKLSLVNLLEKENLRNVILLGQVDYDEIKNIYKAADIVIVPSIYTERKFAEATSLAALEAMASRSTVIVTKVGGLKEIVKDQITGFVIEDKSSIEIAKKMHFILDLSAKEKIEAILDQAYQYVLQEHEYVKHSEKILSFFSIIK